MASTRKQRVVFSFLGVTLDAGTGPGRWKKWRPTLALCTQPDLPIDRLELFHEARFEPLAALVESDLREAAPSTRVCRTALEAADPWDLEEVYALLHDYAVAYPFDPEREEYLVHITTGTHVQQICFFLLTEARYFPARLVQTGMPRKDRATLPVNVIDLDLSRYDRLASRFRKEHQDGQAFLKQGIATRNPQFNALIEQLEKVAIASRDPLLLTGPTGAGKSMLARRIYQLKKLRRQVDGEFVEVNCATLRGDSAMSALFGHVKGAFTGATADRAGLLRKADRGVLLLDEIGELGADEQAMLLGALEEKTFYPVGSDRPASSDFQLLAGTNRELRAAVAAGRFREDLLARLDLWTFRLPALRERLEDLEPNLEHELEQCARVLGTRVGFSREARARYLAFATGAGASWSSNFRDLNASVRRMATLSEGGRIGEALVEAELVRLDEAWGPPLGETAAAGGELVDHLLPGRALDLFERAQLSAVLSACRTARSLSDAGRRLFAVSRQRKSSSNDTDRLRKYLARFGLDWSAVRGR